MTDPIRIGNCSGFYGDRLSAMRELLEGEPLDVVTGDYLAELTMLILGKDRLRDPALGYARTFVGQVADCVALALERGVRIVANAGGLNPAGLAAKLAEVAAAQGLAPAIGYVDGDDLAPRATELGFAGALTANAYLGAFGIARALHAGADIVVTGRVTDASLVVGPAIWRHGWAPTSYDELAGAVVAGHVIECGTQATGGNFSGFTAMACEATPLGFPIAEVSADGSSVITKHPGTGGLVSVDTVTAQLMYEVQGPLYLGPDVTTDLTSIALAQAGDDRVAVTGVRGQPPPHLLKVCVNTLGGYRNQVELVLTGLDVEEKAAWVRTQLDAALDPLDIASRVWSTLRVPAADADTEEGASCLLRLVVKDSSADPVGRAFTSAAVELALGSYPGFTMTGPPGRPSPYGVYTPAYVARAEVAETVHLPDGSTVAIDAPPTADAVSPKPGTFPGTAPGASSPIRRLPLGTLVHARSGDKGGDANIGVWVSAEHGDDAVAWLAAWLDEDRVRALLPETAGLPVRVHPLPNLRGLNIYVEGLLGDGVAAGTRFDPQAKGLGEWLRSRLVDLPEEARMTFLTDERRALAEATRTFVAREVAAHLQDWEDSGEVPRSLHLAAAKAGLLGVSFPTTVGGEGGDLLDSVAMQEAFFNAGASSGLAAALFTGGIALPHLATNGTADLVDRFVRPALAGEKIGSLAVTEPSGGSDVAGIRTTAVRDGDAFVVNGSKTFITSGVRADFVTTAVRTGGPGHAGISLLVVEKGTPGLTVDRALTKMGWHCSDTAELSYVDVRVPVANLVGAESSGFAQIAEQFVVERIGLAVHAYGIAARSLELTAAYCRQRDTFGKPLIARQVVRHRLVEMHRQVEVARSYTRSVAERHVAGESVVAEACLAKQTAVDASAYVVDQAVQLHGGVGYLHGTEVERHYRDQRILGIGGGSTEVLTDLSARLLGYAS